MIIYQVTGYYPPHIGGIEFCAQSIAEQLAERGHSVTVVTSNIGCGTCRAQRGGRMTVHYLRGVELAHTPVIPGLLTTLLRAPRGAVFHVHLAHVAVELQVVLASLIRGIPYIAHFHMQGIVSGRLGFAFVAYQRLVLPHILRRAARVVVVSREQRELLVTRYRVRGDRTVVIPNGVSEMYFAADRGERENAGPPRLLFVGRFAAQKNLPRLLNAMTYLKHDVEVQLVGDGELRGEVARLVAFLGLDNVTIHAPRLGADLAEAYRRADLFVLTSDREGMPLALLEAMASGLPVVAFAAPGVREYVAGRGILVEEDSPEAFAAAVDELLDRPEEQRRLGGAAQSWAKRHSWSSRVDRLEELYGELTS